MFGMLKKKFSFNNISIKLNFDHALQYNFKHIKFCFSRIFNMICSDRLCMNVLCNVMYDVIYFKPSISSFKLSGKLTH